MGLSRAQDGQHAASAVPVPQAATAHSYHTAFLPHSGHAHWPAAVPTASKRGVGIDECDGGKHKKWFLTLQAEMEVSHLNMSRWERDKATNRRRAAVGQEVEHQPEDVVRQMAYLAAG